MKSSYQHGIWHSYVIIVSPIFHSVSRLWLRGTLVTWFMNHPVFRLTGSNTTDRQTDIFWKFYFVPAWVAELGLMWHFNLQGIINYTDLLELYFKQTILSTSNIFCIDLFLNLLAINLSPCYRSPCYQSPSYWSPGYLSLSISLKFFGYILPPPIANCPNT